MRQEPSRVASSAKDAHAHALRNVAPTPTVPLALTVPFLLLRTLPFSLLALLLFVQEKMIRPPQPEASNRSHFFSALFVMLLFAAIFAWGSLPAGAGQDDDDHKPPSGELRTAMHFLNRVRARTCVCFLCCDCFCASIAMC